VRRRAETGRVSSSTHKIRESVLARTRIRWQFVCIGLASIGLLGCHSSHNVVIMGNLDPSTKVRVDGKTIQPVRTDALKPFGNINAEIKSPFSTLVIETRTVVVTAKIQFKNIDGFIFVHEEESPYVTATNELEILDIQVSNRSPGERSMGGLDPGGSRKK
jgi:hypothetical protein